MRNGRAIGSLKKNGERKKCRTTKTSKNSDDNLREIGQIRLISAKASHDSVPRPRSEDRRVGSEDITVLPVSETVAA